MYRASCLVRAANPRAPPNWVVDPLCAAAPSLAATQRYRKLEAAAMRAEAAEANKGYFFLPDFDYPVEGGIPSLFSAAQLQLHREHHKHHVEQLNKLTLGSIYEGQPLAAIVQSSAFDATQAAIHTNAAAHWNHCFFWKSIKPWGMAVPKSLRHVLDLQYRKSDGASRGISELQETFTHAALTQAISGGWVWVVTDGSKFSVWSDGSGSCPIVLDKVPLIGIDLSEHAYAVDYGANVGAYIDRFWKHVDWYMVSATVKRLDASSNA